MSSIKIHLTQLNTTVGDLDGNCKKILKSFKKAEEENCDLAVFCEMSLTGYPCEDLWQKKSFLAAAEEKISEICAATNESTFGSGCAILLGAPLVEKSRNKDTVYNSALLIEKGEVKKIIRKKTIPNYSVFDEKRYFEASPNLSCVEFKGLTLAILICEDLWDAKNIFLLKEQIFDAAIVINSSPYSTKKHEARQKIIARFSQQIGKPLVYLNQVGAQDSLVFDGCSSVIDAQGNLIVQLAEFSEDDAVVTIEKNGAVALTRGENPTQNFDELRRDYSACILGLRDYLHKNNFKKVLLGMSGGIDSALVATMAVDALGSENVALYALPSRYNSSDSMIDAKECAKNLNAKLKEISIEETFQALQFTLREHLTGAAAQLAQENLQSRIRGNMLMTLSNVSGALLLSTGNKSELATGYATIYGDMCGAFNPIKDLYKTRIYELAKWRNDNVPTLSLHAEKNLIPQNILTKAPTAELRENQKDSDSLPDYDMLDKILFALIEEQKSSKEIIALGFPTHVVEKVSKLLHSSEYKRKQAAPGVKISEMSFDKERRIPVTNKFFN